MSAGVEPKTEHQNMFLKDHVRVNQYQAYIEACRRHTELSCNVPPFLTLHSVNQGALIPADTPSIWSYSLSPLKTSQVTEVSWLVLPDQVLLL